MEFTRQNVLEYLKYSVFFRDGECRVFVIPPKCIDEFTIITKTKSVMWLRR